MIGLKIYFTFYSYAFIELSSEEAAEKNLELLNQKKVHGRPIYVDYVGAKSKNPKARVNKPEGKI